MVGYLGTLDDSAGYVGMDERTGRVLFVIGLMALLIHFDKMFSVLKIAGAFAMFTMLGKQAFGASGNDCILAFAAVLGMSMLPALLKRIMTIAATYPLALSFPLASKILPKYTIDESNFFKCDGCSQEVAEVRKQALIELHERWQKKI